MENGSIAVGRSTRGGKQRFGGNLGMDAQEFVDPMRAGMALEDGFPPARCEGLRQLWLMQNVAQVLGHLFAGGRDKKVRAGMEEPFHIGPRRADQWNAA